MDITIRSLGGTKNKLHFIKLLKDYTNLGLRESKDLCDNIHENINLAHEFSLKDDQSFESFFIKINELGRFEINGGLVWERNSKMLDLGIGKENLPNYIAEYILSITAHRSYEKSIDILSSKLEKLEQSKLEDIYKVITKKE